MTVQRSTDRVLQRTEWCLRWSISLAAGALLVAGLTSRAAEACSSRPGTPNEVSAVAISATEIDLRWQNTTDKGSGDSHSMFFDIEVRDGAGNASFNVTGGAGKTRIRYGSRSVQKVSQLQPSSTYCFRMRARTVAGTGGCVSEVFSNQACANTPSLETNSKCEAYARSAVQQANRLKSVPQTAKCRAEGPRWTSDEGDHFRWCIRTRELDRASVEGEQKVREDIINGCGNAQASPAPAVPVPPNLAPNLIEALNAHNAYRAEQCAPPLRWSEKLAAEAQAHANKCIFKHSDQSTRPGQGENLAWGGLTISPRQATDDWYMEKNDYKFDDPKCCDNPTVGHFTQIVWRSTTELGCALASCPPPAPPNDTDYNGPWQYVVCRYAPPGNVSANQQSVLRAEVGCKSQGLKSQSFKPQTLPATPYVGQGGSPLCYSGMVMNTTGSCACPAGSVWSGRNCVSPSPTIEPRPLPARAEDVGRPARSAEPAGMRNCPVSRPVGTFPNCCPLYTTFNGRACVTTDQAKRDETNRSQLRACPADRPVGQPPGCCPVGTYFERGRCRRSGTTQHFNCPADRPVGTPPNCCPSGTAFQNGACRPPSRGAPDSTVATCPVGRPVGSPPNCCPRGTNFDRGMCRPTGSAVPRTTTCPASRPVGSPPNCCPTGTRFEQGVCRANRPQQQQPAPQQPAPRQPTSPADVEKYKERGPISPLPAPPKPDGPVVN